jgi:hypothetical protein
MLAPLADFCVCALIIAGLSCAGETQRLHFSNPAQPAQLSTLENVYFRNKIFSW